MVQNTPRCRGGHLEHRRYLGKICDICHTPVESPRDQRMDSLLWLCQPKKIAKLINPTVFSILANHFKKSGFNIIHWLTDKDYAKPTKTPSIMPALEALKLPRGYNNFVNNFFPIVEKLFTIGDFRRKKKDAAGGVHPILRWLRENEDKIFSQYLPLPNKMLMVVEDTDMSTYMDSSTPIAVDAIASLIGFDDPDNNYTDDMRQNRIGRFYAGITRYYNDYYQSTLSGKEGVFRKHGVATRSENAFRAVISSIQGVHRHDEVYISWGVGIGLYYHYLATHLIREGWLPNEIKRFLNRHVSEYNEKIDSLFKKIISGTRPKWIGTPIILQRNPTLGRGSAQRLFITRVKTDPDDLTTSISSKIVRSPNADYDGDEMNGVALTDDRMAEGCEAFAPYKNVMSTSTPRMVSSALSKPKPYVSMMASYFDAAPTLPINPVIAERMALLRDAP